MRARFVIFVLLACFVASCLASQHVSAADKKQVPPAPPPAQIVTAQKVLITNGGQDASFSALFANDRAYNQFYAAIKAWTSFAVVDTPSEADVVLEISLVGELKLFGHELTPLPVLRLVILDPKSHTRLWVCNEELESGGFVVVGAHVDSKFDKAMERIVADVKSLMAKPQTAAKP